ncbi:MAG: AraC family transcriptional regulator ligand-binding domain-containing protein [Myxococcota bacterium]
MADSEATTELDIDVCNVRPAFEASLARGVAAEDLGARLGWTPALLGRDGATVSGASTYTHMEWMAQRPDFADFVLDAVQRHTATSLGIVGLACKTSSFLGEAMARHGRYQALTNRTARYDARMEGESLCIEETRFGPPREGSLLVSDYTVLVAVQLIRTLLGPDIAVERLRSRRPEVPPAQRNAWEAFAGAPMETGADKAALVLPAALATAPLPSADVEVSAYFHELLERAAPDVSELSWIDKVQAVIERSLRDGTPTADAVSRTLGVGARSLARRLREEGETFGGLLSSVRQARARTLLGDPNLTQAEVAFLLGYRDQASFHRAFRRWFGTTPAAFRRTL